MSESSGFSFVAGAGSAGATGASSGWATGASSSKCWTFWVTFKQQLEAKQRMAIPIARFILKVYILNQKVECININIQSMTRNQKIFLISFALLTLSLGVNIKEARSHLSDPSHKIPQSHFAKGTTKFKKGLYRTKDLLTFQDPPAEPQEPNEPSSQATSSDQISESHFAKGTTKFKKGLYRTKDLLTFEDPPAEPQESNQLSSQATPSHKTVRSNHLVAQGTSSLGPIQIIATASLSTVTAQGWRLLTLSEAKQIKSDLDKIMGSWSIVGFSTGQYSGSGYGSIFLEKMMPNCGEYAVVKPANSSPSTPSTPQTRIQKFSARLKRQNLGTFYNEDWEQVLSNGFTVDQNANSKDFIQTVNQFSLLTTSKISSSDFSTKVGLEVSPPLSAGIPVDKKESEKKAEGSTAAGTFSIKFETQSVSTVQISTCSMEVFEVDMTKIIKPKDEMLNFFRDNFGGQINENSVQKFFERYGNWMAGKVNYGGQAYTQESKQVNSRDIGSSISVNAGMFVPALKALNPTIKSEISDKKKEQIMSSNYILKGMKASDKNLLMNNDFNGISVDQIVPVKAYLMQPITILLPYDMKMKIEATQYFKNNVKTPQMSVISEFRSLFKQEWSPYYGQVGARTYSFDSSTDQSLKDWAITGLTGYWGNFLPTDKDRLYNIMFTFGYFGSDPKVANVPKIYYAGRPNGFRYTSRMQGQIILNYAVHKIKTIEIGIDNDAYGIGCIRITTTEQGAPRQVLGREDLVAGWKTLQLDGGVLVGVDGAEGRRVDGIRFKYKVNTAGMEARISRKILKS